MNIDFTAVLKDQDEMPMKDIMTMQNNGGVDVILTLGRAASHALNVQSQAEADLSGEEKFNRGMLAFKIRDSASCELKVEDVALIKKQMAKLYSPIVIYRAYPLLDVGEKANG
jgi:hypothetical protein